MTIYIKKLSYEERVVYGACPVCGAQAGELCKQDAAGEPASLGELVTLVDPDLGPGAHIARLINAPKELVISDDKMVERQE